jgi:hypothetical protein
MRQPHILTTLRRKRAEIEAVIAAYEAKIDAVDLAALDKALRLFDSNACRFQVFAFFELGSAARLLHYVATRWNGKGR